MPRVTYFFAPIGDLGPWLDWLETKLNIEYIPMDPSDSDSIRRFKSYREVEDFGSCRFGSFLANDHYLLVPSGTPVPVDYIPVGPEKGYFPDGAAVPTSMFLRPGGSFAPDVLIAGSFGVGKHQVNAGYYKQARQRLISGWRKSSNYYISPASEQLLKKGGRLVPQDIRQDRSYDVS